ncbi:TPA: hypothetical protein N5L14_003377 [Enterobacter hormaechei subsp. steigerwaltii]|nr:hypothetical protein [Enterobacter hormaechei subsp. steigerwaltii]
MKKIILLIISALFFSTNSFAYYIYGSGASTCKEWVSDEDSDSSLVSSRRAWTSGYMSGLNAGVGQELFFDDGIDLSTTYDYIIFYCRAHPDDSPASAIAEMIIKIRKENTKDKKQN